MAHQNYQHIRRFDPSKMRKNAHILFSGPPGSGKSFTMRDFMWWVSQQVFDAYAFTGSIEDEHPLSDYIPDTHVFEEFNASVLREIVTLQEYRRDVALNEAKSRGLPGSEARMYPTLLLFEDMEYKSKSILSFEPVRKIIMNRRWLKMYVFVVFQYLMEFKCALRGMIDYAVFCKEPSATTREKIWRAFGGCCRTFDEFDAIFKACTQNKGVIVIDTQATDYGVENSIFWYRAKERGPFRVGSPLIWQTHQSRYQPRIEKIMATRLNAMGGRGPTTKDGKHIVLEIDEEDEKPAGGKKKGKA